MLKGKRILLGVSGSIAAYKSAHLIRLFAKAGAEVKVILTQDAAQFITPLTLSTLSKNPVYQNFISSEDGTWNNHVELGLWADIFIIAPATANTIAKMAHGICDNLLLATYLSSKCPVFVAPAMDLDMWLHPSTQNNIQLIQSFGNKILSPQDGELASGLNGVGRLMEPEEVVSNLENFFKHSQRFKGKKVLISAGPTYEKLDPVRFIGNFSSGKMGYALAEEMAHEGAEVHLVSGPSHLKVINPRIKLTQITSSDEMFEACTSIAPKMDVIIMAAAVADYKPESVAKEKIKKADLIFLLKLAKTRDILKELGAKKSKKQILVGFALETENAINNAIKKLENKNLDFIVLNSLKEKGAGFATDTNKITIIDKAHQITEYGLKDKSDVAKDIIDKIVEIKNA